MPVYTELQYPSFVPKYCTPKILAGIQLGNLINFAKSLEKNLKKGCLTLTQQERQDENESNDGFDLKPNFVHQAFPLKQTSDLLDLSVLYVL